MTTITNSLINGLSATLSQIKTNPRGMAQLFNKLLKIETTPHSLPKEKYSRNNCQSVTEGPSSAVLKIQEKVKSISESQKPTALKLTLVQLSTPLPERRFNLGELLGLSPTSESAPLSASVTQLAAQLREALSHFEKSTVINHEALQPEGEAETLQHTPSPPPESQSAVKTSSTPATPQVDPARVSEPPQKHAPIHPDTMSQPQRNLPDPVLPEKHNAVVPQHTPSSSPPPPPPPPPPQSLTPPAVKILQRKPKNASNKQVAQNAHQEMMAELTKKLAKINPEAFIKENRPQPQLSKPEPVHTTDNNVVVSPNTRPAPPPPPPPPPPPQNQSTVKTLQPKLKRNLSEPVIIDPRQAIIAELTKKLAQRNPAGSSQPSSVFHRTKSESSVTIQNNENIIFFEEKL